MWGLGFRFGVVQYLGPERAWGLGLGAYGEEGVHGTGFRSLLIVDGFGLRLPHRGRAFDA